MLAGIAAVTGQRRFSPARALSAAFFCFSTAFGGILLRYHSPGCRYKSKGVLPRHASQPVPIPSDCCLSASADTAQRQVFEHVG